jgi:glutamate dehydrogenase (NAD(P)+)
VGYLVSRGFSVVGVADVHGAIHIPHGVHPEELARHVATTGTVVGLSSAEPVDLADFFTLDADIAIPAALGGVLNADVASRMKAGIVIEAANGPTTGDGAAVFADKKTIVVPDVLANAGGVVASYFEWAQDLQGMLWEPEVFTARLERTMKAAFDHVWQRHEAWDVILREAALAVGVERIAEATELRGLFP